MDKSLSTIQTQINQKGLEPVLVAHLQLDVTNPRFGETIDGDATQNEVLNNIVKNYGVTDVISSLAVNGYFSAEPMVVKKVAEDKHIVMEGNRRLAACLILLEDDRARDQLDNYREYIDKYKENSDLNISSIPAIVFDGDVDKKSLVSYLGVRHIVSTKDWDSFAKAAWIARTISEGDMNVQDISSMIGDKHSTIKRLLTGYHFVKQMERTGKYNKEDSIKKGRGSNTSYPFSWVYTLLGYTSIQNFVGLSQDATNDNPIETSKLDNAKLVMTAMFGNKREGVDSKVKDSRNLGALAEIVASPEKLRLLQSGKNINEIAELMQPVDERVNGLMLGIRDNLDEVISRMGRDLIQKDTAIYVNGLVD